MSKIKYINPQHVWTTRENWQENTYAIEYTEAIIGRNKDRAFDQEIYNNNLKAIMEMVDRCIKKSFHISETENSGNLPSIIS